VVKGGTMASDTQRPDRAQPEPAEPAEDDRTGERVYDSFVVRLWREVGNPRLLRVEVEHAQSGGAATARGVEIDWVGARIVDLVSEPRSPPPEPRGTG
jgi:hypothetical protein